MTASIDDYTFDHLCAWIHRTVTEDVERAIQVMSQMLALVHEDTEYWLAQGWPRVYDASGAQYPE